MALRGSRILLPPVLFVKQLEGEVEVGDDLAAALLYGRCEDAVFKLLGGLAGDAQGMFDADDAVDIALGGGGVGIAVGLSFKAGGKGGVL